MTVYLLTYLRQALLFTVLITFFIRVKWVRLDGGVSSGELFIMSGHVTLFQPVMLYQFISVGRRFYASRFH